MNKNKFREIARTLALVLAMSFGMSPMTAHAADEWQIPTSAPQQPFEGKGTSTSPYLISSAQDLANLAYMIAKKYEQYKGKYFRQTCDIVLNDNLVKKDSNGKSVEGDGTNTAKQWLPMGDCGTIYDSDFMGIYDGDGHSISGIYYNQNIGSQKYVGLFACTDEARISNLTIKDSYINAINTKNKYTYVGALAGDLEKTTVSNCHVKNSIVKATSSIGGNNLNYEVYLGGLIGLANGATITNSDFEGYLRGIYENENDHAYYMVGGIVGEAYDAATSILNCRSQGEIESTQQFSVTYYAGVVGRTYKVKSLTMEGCYSSMHLNINDPGPYTYIAGLVNTHIGSSAINIRQCAYAGNIDYQNWYEGLVYISGIANGDRGAAIYSNPTVNIDKCAVYATINMKGYFSEETDINGLYFYAENVNNTICKIKFTHTDNIRLFDPISTGYIGKRPTINECYYDATNNGVQVTSTNSKAEGTTYAVTDAFKGEEWFKKLNGQDPSAPLWGFFPVDEEDPHYDYILPIACGGKLNTLLGNGTEDNPYLINTANDLRNFAVYINEGYISNTSNTYCKLNANIDMNDADTELPTIGDEQNPFRGTFDGNGHQIANLKKTNNGMFGVLSGTVKNLALNNYTFNGASLTIGSIAGWCNGGKIENCYVTGIFDVQKDVTDIYQFAAGISGACTDAHISNCYFYGKMMLPNDYTPAYFGSISGNGGDITNCYGIVTNEEVQGKLIVTKGVTNCKTNEEAQQLSLSDAWLPGYYHPVLKDAYNYEATAPDGKTVYLDPATDITPTNNDILCLKPTDKNKDDYMAYALPNVAVYTEDSEAYILVNGMLVDDKPLNFTAGPEHANAPVKGLMNYRVKSGSWQMLCLPGEVDVKNQPEGSKLYIGGTLNKEKHLMNLVEVESVPAGVPFVAYIAPVNDKANEGTDGSTGDAYITMTNELVMSPQTQEGSSLKGTFKTLTDLSNICSGISNNGEQITPATEVKPFHAYIEDSDGEISLVDYLLLDEQSNNIAEIIEANAGSDTTEPKEVNIKMRRDLKVGGWNTICLPFDLSEDEVKQYFGNDCQLERLYDVDAEPSSDANAEDASLVMKFEKADEIAAGSPYILKLNKAPESDIYDFGKRKLTQETKAIYEPGIKVGDDLSVNFSMIPSYPKVYLESEENTSYFFIQQNSIYRATVEAPVVMNGFRCYLTAENMSQKTAEKLMTARMIHADGSTTSIKITTVGKQGNSTRIFDLQGMEHKSMQRGVNIVGGKKIIK